MLLCITIIDAAIMMLFYTSYYGTIIHEIGHCRTANKYHRTTGIITHKYFPYKKPLKIGNVTWSKCTEKQVNGGYHPDNKFQPYSDDEICKIAKAGYRYSLAGSIVYALLHIPLIMLVYQICQINQYKVSYLILCMIIYFIYMGYNYLRYKLGKLKSEWNDYRVWHEPAQYREYEKNRENNLKQKSK